MQKPLKSKLFFIVLCFCLLQNYQVIAQASFQWAKQMGGSNNDYARSIATDAVGNIYTAGAFNGITDFDPGAGTYTLASYGEEDIFISKLDASGNFIWAKQMGGTSPDEALSIAIDVTGNVYITGDFSGTADFDPGPVNYIFNSLGGRDIFISKINGSGNFVWAKQIGSTLSDYGHSIIVDAGNIYISGYFSNTADFDPGPGTFTFTSVGNADIFVSKLDGAGNFIWAKQMGGTFLDIAYSQSIDASGNILIGGCFRDTSDFDPGPGTYTLEAFGNSDIFISKLDASGNFIWAKQMGGTFNDEALSITTDPIGNVYSTGDFFGVTDFDPGPGTYTLGSVGDQDIFISKLDASGNFIWAKQMGGTLSDYGTCITRDISGNIYTTGIFQSTTDFDPGIGTFTLSSMGGLDIFISELDVTGNFVLAHSMGSIGYDYGYSISLDANENVYSTGCFQGTVDFDPGAGVFNLTSNAGYDIFVHKMGAEPNSLNELSTSSKPEIFPNPSNGILNFNISSSSSSEVNEQINIHIINVLGQVVFNEAVNIKNLALNISNLISGIYFVKIENSSWIKTHKIVKQ